MVSLPDLPLEVLETICRPLGLRDRVALTSCCRTLLARPDVAGSAQLWGELEKSIEFGSGQEPPSAGFFSRRAAGLRTLDFYVEFQWKGRTSADLAALLSTLGGSGLVDLEIFAYEYQGMERALGGALQPLSRLAALTRLAVHGSDVEGVPAHLSALQQLAHLDLSYNQEVGGPRSPASFEGLAHLLALTSLDLSECALQEVPLELSSLPRLQTLLLNCNPRLGEGCGMVIEGLGGLRALRILGLCQCELQDVPWQLATLPALEVLDLDLNPALGEIGPAEDWYVLCELTGLTRLTMSGCQLRFLSLQLAGLAALAHLELGFNVLGSRNEEEEEEEGAEPFLPLERLTALTHLDLRDNALPAVPPQVAALAGLVELDLSRNEALGEAGEVAFQPILCLSALTLLNLGTAGLGSLPRQLSALGGCLLELDLSRNEGLGLNASGQAFWPLRHANALTALRLNHCSLERLPLELSALVALKSLELCGNEGLGLEQDYDQAFGPLRCLCVLTSVALNGTGLRNLPPQLSELRALRGLDVSDNWALGQGDQDSPSMWRQLVSLPALKELIVGGCGLDTAGSPAPPALVELARQGVHVIAYVIATEWT